MAEQPPGRRRGAELEQAILRAAMTELLESGYPGFTIDKVAKRAGTNKNAIYRRWPNRTALAIAAYLNRGTDQPPPPDTGELRGDMLALLRQMNRHWTSSEGGILRGLLAAAGDEPQLAAGLVEQLRGGGLDVCLRILGRAVARGEAPPEAVQSRVATVALVLLRNEYGGRGGAAVPDEVIVEIVDEVYLPLVRGRGAAA